MPWEWLRSLFGETWAKTCDLLSAWTPKIWQDYGNRMPVWGFEFLSSCDPILLWRLLQSHFEACYNNRWTDEQKLLLRSWHLGRQSTGAVPSPFRYRYDGCENDVRGIWCRWCQRELHCLLVQDNRKILVAHTLIRIWRVVQLDNVSPSFRQRRRRERDRS